MFTRRNPRKRKVSHPASHGHRYRRLGVERVEDRCLLAAVAFQTGMEAQLTDSANDAGSISLAIIAGPAIFTGVLPAGNSSIYFKTDTFGASGTASLQTGTASQQNTNGGLVSANTGLPPTHDFSPVTTGGTPLSTSNGLSPPPASSGTPQAASSGPATVWGYTIDNDNTGVITPSGPMQVSPVIVQSGGGSGTLYPIPVGLLPPEAPPPSPVGSLPSATPPSAPQPSPIPAPIDIGLVLNNPLAPIQCPVSPPESGMAPVMISSGPSTNPAPSGVTSKPDVEGNRGKSQLFDVAGTQSPQTLESRAPSPGSFVAVSSAPPADEATSTASDVSAAIGETARGDDPGSQANSAVADGMTGIAASSESDAAILPRHFAAVSDGYVANSSPAQQASRQERVMPAEKRAAVAVSASPAAASDHTAAGLAVVAGAKPEENAGKPFTAAAYRRLDIVGLAVLAFAGQHLGQRWSRYVFIEPRPIVIGRKKPIE